jgi:hypothetical protein
MAETDHRKFPRDSNGAFPPELELAALGVLSRLAKERGLLIGKPFELADAQVLLTLLELALPAVVTNLAQRAEDRLKNADADNSFEAEASLRNAATAAQLFRKGEPHENPNRR